MTEFMTRREMREAERKGLKPKPRAEAGQPLEKELVTVANTTIEPVVAEPASPQPQVFLTRREMREAERKGISLAPAIPQQISPTPKMEIVPLPDLEAASQEIERIAVSDVATFDLPPADFTGNNLLAEPSTQSIVLDVAPEAIALPIETGEVAITGSIAVLTEPSTGSITGGLDGIDLDNADRQDAVTGVISIVEPLSALDVINSRASVGVVPKSVLRRGWWRVWVIGLGALLMAAAAILATVTILNAIGA